jgi:glucose/arabinose dehydrogenase
MNLMSMAGLPGLLALPIALGASLPIPQLTTELVTTIPSFTGEVVTFIVQSPIEDDERLYIGGKTGRAYTFEPGGSPEIFLNISSITSTTSERGLLFLVFHPQFGTDNWFFFINHTNLAGHTVIARYEMDADDRTVVDTTTRKELLTINQDFANHNGGAMAFGPDGFLYIAMGDGGDGNDPNCRAQDLTQRLGKMLRIDVDQSVNTAPFYGIPPDNPYVGVDDVPDEIFFVGLRNPWRFSFDRDTGDMWIGDVGQAAREEVDHILHPLTPALNFGWPIREGEIQNPAINTIINNCSGAGVAIPPLDFEGFTQPVHTYVRGTNNNRAITGGYVYRGAKSPGLFGRYVFGDYNSGRVWVLDPADYSVVERFVLGMGLTTFGEGRDGELYLSSNRQVRRIVPIPPEIPDHLSVR